MANGAWSEKVVQLLRRMNSFYFPGTKRTLLVKGNRSFPALVGTSFLSPQARVAPAAFASR